jgi:hypothetical protein
VYEYKKLRRSAVLSAVAALTISFSFAGLRSESVPPGTVLFAVGIKTTALWLLFFPGLVFLHRHRERKAQVTKVIEGTKLLSPAAFNKTVQGDGIGIPCRIARKTELLKIPANKERYHTLIMGDSGTGKSTIFHSLLCQTRDRGEFAIIYDPSLQFWKRHARPGDILLHPLSPHCPNWIISREITNPLNAKAIAKSFLPDKEETTIRKDFWDSSSQRIFRAALLRMKLENKGTADLLGWLRNPQEIDKTVRNTEHAYLIAQDAPEQRGGVLGTLSEVAEILSLLPTTGSPFSFHDWSQNRQGWIFIGSQGEEERDALRPLISAWLDIALGKLMLHEDETAPLTRVFLDELPTLQRLPKLKTAVSEGRKYNLRFCLGFQGRSQVKDIYGESAEALLSTPATKVILRTSHYDAATWGADTIGRPLQERPSQSYSESYGSLLQGIPRDSFSHRTERRTEHLVIPNVIQNLEDRTGFLRFDKYVVPIEFDYFDLPNRNHPIHQTTLPRSGVLSLPSPMKVKRK